MDTELILVIVGGLVGPGGVFAVLLNMLNKKEKAIEKLTERIEQLEEDAKRLPELEQQVATLIRQIEELQAKLDDKSKLLEQITNERDQLRADLNGKVLEITHLTGKLSGYETAFKEIGGERTGKEPSREPAS